MSFKLNTVYRVLTLIVTGLPQTRVIFYIEYFKCRRPQLGIKIKPGREPTTIIIVRVPNICRYVPSPSSIFIHGIPFCELLTLVTFVITIS